MSTMEQAMTSAPSLMMDADDIAALRATVAGVLAESWPDATHAASGDLGEVWQAAAGQGWTSLAGEELFPAALAVQEELGSLACPLPVVDAWLAATLLARLGAVETAHRIAEGEVRLVLAFGSPADGAVRHVEAGSALTDLLVIDADANRARLYELAAGDVTELPGLPVPAWSGVRLGSAGWETDLAPHADLLLLWRVGLAARATAAVARSHALALEHAGRRVQFGQPVGAFQAVSHRLVEVETVLAAAAQLRDHALALWGAGDPSWELAAGIYVAYVSERLAKLQFDSHHTLAAVGYFEEHEAPWLFRRVHADLAVLAASASGPALGERLLAGETLPGFDLGPAAEQVRARVSRVLAPWRDGPPSHLGAWDDAARDALREHGLLGVGWPADLGGGGYDEAQLLAFSEAVAYASPPVGNIWMGIDSIVPMLVKVGPEPLRDLVMAEARSGTLSIALGYSEPESGSDLASLRTRAVRVEGGWKVSGQKLWGTCVPDSKWIMLAARTDPDAKPHAGISLFLVDLDSPGITVQEHRSLGGEISATTFWDDVFVPEDRLVGVENRGWAALGAALAAERVLIGATVMKALRTFERLVDLVAGDQDVVLPGRRSEVTREIQGIAVELQAARALVNAAVAAVAAGDGSGVEAPMAKIVATELAEKLHARAISLLGPDALYAPGVSDVPGGGHLEDGLRGSIMGVIAGGTGDIQRNLIARQMGLPR